MGRVSQVQKTTNVFPDPIDGYDPNAKPGLHLTYEQKGKIVKTKCGKTVTIEDATIWWTNVSCPDCKPWQFRIYGDTKEWRMFNVKTGKWAGDDLPIYKRPLAPPEVVAFMKDKLHGMNPMWNGVFLT